MRFDAFDGARVYNGCPDSTMQRRLDEIKQLMSRLHKIRPEAHVTFFPSGDEYGWIVHEWGMPLSRHHETKLDALREALARLEEVNHAN
jgi:hypothetical protein